MSEIRVSSILKKGTSLVVGRDVGRKTTSLLVCSADTGVGYCLTDEERRWLRDQLDEEPSDESGEINLSLD